MTYNIRHGRGSDGRIDIARVAEVIASFAPDVVGLQEVDVGCERSGGIDQAAELASQLGMESSFAPVVERGCERHGIATLSRLPIVQTRQVYLPRQPHRYRSEPRCALVTRLEWPTPDRALDIMNTHLSTLFGERPAQVAAIVKELEDDELIVLGDLNCTPWSPAYRTLCVDLRSATRRARSWPSKLPVVPIDHILFRGPLHVIRSGTWSSGSARHASDHLPVIAELEYEGGT
jgi:endonuclease/exonuclease/phosphatase family metal-dependent hydrolase